MSDVNKLCVRFLDGKDVKVLCRSKFYSAGWGVMESFIPCGSAEDYDFSGIRGKRRIHGREWKMGAIM